METVFLGDEVVFTTSACKIIKESNIPKAPHSPAKRLLGAVVDWQGEPKRRMSGDDLHFPGVMPDGSRVWVSRYMTFFFD